MSRSTRRIVSEAAASLGFMVCEVKAYLRRIPGEARNERWHEVALLCPCGATKRLHIKHTSLPRLSAELADHLRRDGLIT
ncbi:MAG: hypothetical protein ACRC2H_01120 [Silanimonas sp.]